ncbi:MAG: glycoside hydrolase family 2, partial [Bacteroidales bacterium]|nr:glycoside hydrolase family 2 [Bacteroidales bacterium]
DENGVPVMLSENEITCVMSNNGELLGLEGSNNSDMSDYTDNKHRVYHGRMIAYIKSATENVEDIKVSFSSPWLESVETLIEIK